MATGTAFFLDNDAFNFKAWIIVVNEGIIKGHTCYGVPINNENSPLFMALPENGINNDYQKKSIMPVCAVGDAGNIGAFNQYLNTFREEKLFDETYEYLPSVKHVNANGFFEKIAMFFTKKREQKNKSLKIDDIKKLQLIFSNKNLTYNVVINQLSLAYSHSVEILKSTVIQ